MRKRLWITTGVLLLNKSAQHMNARCKILYKHYFYSFCVLSKTKQDRESVETGFEPVSLPLTAVCDEPTTPLNPPTLSVGIQIVF